MNRPGGTPARHLSRSDGVLGDVLNPTFANLTVAAFSHVGRWLAYAADGRVDEQYDVYVADVSSGRVGETHTLHEAAVANSTVNSLGFSASGAIVWSVGILNRSTVDVWFADLSTGTPGTSTKINTTGLADEYQFAP
jgi:hypothetical protein